MKNKKPSLWLLTIPVHGFLDSEAGRAAARTLFTDDVYLRFIQHTQLIKQTARVILEEP